MSAPPRAGSKHSTGYGPVQAAIETLAQQPAKLGRRGRLYVVPIVVPERHSGVQAHLRDSLDSSIVDRAGLTETNLGSDVAGDYRRLVVTGPTGLAHRQIDGIAQGIHPVDAIHLQGFMVRRQPAFVGGGLGQAALLTASTAWIGGVAMSKSNGCSSPSSE